MTARILVFAGSIRSGAFSGKVADRAVKTLALQGATPTRILLSDYPLPIMDEDLERERGIPEMAERLARQIHDHDGLLIATPEYNGSLPPLLKNAIDWVTRVKVGGARAFSGKPVGLASSSDGQYAGIRSIGHLRAILSHIGCEVVAAQCSVPRAQEAFDADGNFLQKHLQAHMERVARSLIERCAATANRR
jgi:NAD(P)H-dependent FMN reductase